MLPYYPDFTTPGKKPFVNIVAKEDFLLFIQCFQSHLRQKSFFLQIIFLLHILYIQSSPKNCRLEKMSNVSVKEFEENEKTKVIFQFSYNACISFFGKIINQSLSSNVHTMLSISFCFSVAKTSKQLGLRLVKSYFSCMATLLLTLYHTIPIPYDEFRNHCGKRKICW